MKQKIIENLKAGRAYISAASGEALQAEYFVGQGCGVIVGGRYGVVSSQVGYNTSVEEFVDRMAERAPLMEWYRV